jgi:hypothetical protein
MKLADMCATLSELRFPRLGEDAHPDRDAVIEVRSRLTAALAHGEFLIDCIAHELQFLARCWERLGLAPFFVAPEFGVSFSFGYWRPGQVALPHEHTAWSISAVCHNCLEVSTFDRAESYLHKQLVPMRRFTATVGQVGYIYGPAIHSPRNATDDWTVSLHIYSPRDGEPAADTEPLPGLAAPAPQYRLHGPRHPYAWVTNARRRKQEADLLGHLLLVSDLPCAAELFAACAELSSSTTRTMLQAAAPDRCVATKLPDRFVRIRPELQLSLEHEASSCVLLVDAPRGRIEVLRVDALAAEMLAAVVASPSFDPRALPGDLDDDERASVIDALEDLGLVRSARP